MIAEWEEGLDAAGEGGGCPKKDRQTFLIQKATVALLR